MSNLGLLTKVKSGTKDLSWRDSFGFLVLICLGVGAISICLQMLLLVNSFRIANKPAPTLVQLSTGESISVIPIGSGERTPEAIQKFVKDMLAMTFNWTGTIPNPDPEKSGVQIPDSGVEITTQVNGRSMSRRITTAAYEALFAFEAGFRQEFLSQLASLTPEAIFNQEGQVAFIPLQISSPQRVAAGQWKVTVISNLLFMRRGRPLGDLVPFNKEIYVRAVEPPSLDDLPEGLISPSLAATVARMRASGLEITAIVDYKPQDLIVE
jgi:hypothetical protein